MNQARTRTEAAASSSGPMGPMKFASLATSFVACFCTCVNALTADQDTIEQKNDLSICSNGRLC